MGLPDIPRLLAAELGVVALQINEKCALCEFKIR